MVMSAEGRRGGGQSLFGLESGLVQVTRSERNGEILKTLGKLQGELHNLDKDIHPFLVLSSDKCRSSKVKEMAELQGELHILDEDIHHLVVPDLGLVQVVESEEIGGAARGAAHPRQGHPPCGDQASEGPAGPRPPTSPAHGGRTLSPRPSDAAHSSQPHLAAEPDAGAGQGGPPARDSGGRLGDAGHARLAGRVCPGRAGGTPRGWWLAAAALYWLQSRWNLQRFMGVVEVYVLIDWQIGEEGQGKLSCHADVVFVMCRIRHSFRPQLALTPRVLCTADF